jgi:hypothetical protein
MKIKLFVILGLLMLFNTLQAQTCNNVIANFCSTTEGATTNFSFSGSEEGVSSFFWDFGDGNTSSLRNPVHTFSSTGSFQSCLTLTCIITTTTGGGGGYGGGGGTTTTTSCTDFLCGNISINANGCTDFQATNYNNLATIDDGTCDYCIYGCTDSLASNYNPFASCEDNSCLDIISKSIYEDFENYDLYDYLAFESPLWTTWSNPLSFVCPEDVRVITSVIDSNLIGGSNAIQLRSNIPSGGPQDIILPFGTSSSYNTGVFIFSAMFNVINSMNTGGAYFNFQSDYSPGSGWALDVNMYANGQITFANNGSNLLTTSYPANIWFELKIAVDITNNSWHIYIDGVSQGSFSNSLNQIASLDLFPLDGHSFWVDEIYSMYNADLIYGCTDSAMYNYDLNATWDDSTCVTYTYGCTDSTMFNYDVNANTDDGSCAPIVYGCTDVAACNFDNAANSDDASCLTDYGCMDATACNYDATANCNSSCDLPEGCGDPLYVEYDTSVTCSDSSACLTFILTEVNEVIDANTEIYPNPTNHSLNIVSGVIVINSISIYNIHAKEVLSAKVNANQIRLDISTLSKGIYIIYIKSNNSSVKRKLIIK